MPYVPPAPPTNVKAASVLVVDDASGKTLYARNSDITRFPASTTKILTGLILAERCKPGDKIRAPKGVEKVIPASMGLKSGEVLSAKALLSGIMLRSANDACVAAAVHISGSVPAFARLMNQRARELGCSGSYFVTPNGLHDPRHVSTAEDLVILGRAALRNPLMAEVVGLRKTTIQRSINQKQRVLYNRNKWLFKDPTAIGIKTGWTTPARNTYVGAIRREFTIVDAILRTESWQDDHQALVAWTYRNWQAGRRWVANESVGSYQIDNGNVALGVAPQTDAAMPIPVGGEEALPSVEITAQIPIRAGDVVGKFILTDGSGYSFDVPLIALNDVDRSLLSYAPAPAAGVTMSAAGLLLFRRRRRRRVP